MFKTPMLKGGLQRNKDGMFQERTEAENVCCQGIIWGLRGEGCYTDTRSGLECCVETIYT